MRLSIVIVSYNVRHYLLQCLDSVQRATEHIDAEVFVVDNHSHDGSAEAVGKAFPHVKVMALPHNEGFSRANDLALLRATGDYQLLLNPDTVVGEEVLQKGLEFMDAHPECGAAGVRMMSAKGDDAHESRRGIPTPMTAFYKFSGLCRRYPHSRRFARYYQGWLPWDEANRIEVVSGAFCLLRKKALKDTGLLDEDFFMYGEDIDLSYRLLKKGWQCWYLPLRILHYKGESTIRSSFRYVHVFYRAMAIFIRKHYRGTSRLLLLPLRIAIGCSALTALCRIYSLSIGQALGLVKHQRNEMIYCFITRSHAAECTQIASRCGIEASIIGDANRQSMPNNACWIFDMSEWLYTDVLATFAQKRREDCTLGFYHPQQHTVITENEILQ